MQSDPVAPTTNGRGGSLWRRSLARVGIAFREGEAAPALLLFLTFFLLITFQYTTKSVRQSAFIQGLGAEKLPWVYLFIAVTSYPLLRIYAAFADRMRRETLIIATCAMTALSMVVFWYLMEFPWAWVAFTFYVWISIVVVMLVSQFWSFANHLFDPRQAKRLFAFVGAGGLLGGIAGGQVAKFATKLVGTRYALLVAAGTLLLVVALIWFSRRISHASDEQRAAGAAGLARLDRARGGFELLRQSQHLRWIAAIMVLTVVVAQIVDLQFSWAVQESTTSLDQRTAFFGNFYSIIGIVAFLFQLIFTARIHRTLGVGFAMRVLPVSMGIGTLALLAAATGFPELILAGALILKTGENGFRYSLDQATRELLFLPIPSRSRVKAKAYIDVFVQRAAKGVAAILLLPVTFGLMTAPQAGWISIALIVVWLGATVTMRRHYVESFRAGLRQRLGGPESIDLADATALALVVQSLGSTDSRQVVHAINLLQKQERTKLVPPLLLYHEHAAVRRATLRVLAVAGRHDALPLIERCLSDADAAVRAEAVRTIAELRQRDIGSLMLPLLGSTDPALAAAAVVALENEGDEEQRRRAAGALDEMMKHGSGEWRAEAAKALGQLRRSDDGYALTLLLGDHDPAVVKEAISAVQRRVARSGGNPMWVPGLIARLDDRRLKHESRRALVAFGPDVIPVLLHFMNSSDERIWVRRALPKTVAVIGGPVSTAGLVVSLKVARDPFLVRKLIEGLAAPGVPAADLALHHHALVEAVGAQAARYFRALAALVALGSAARSRLVSPFIAWDDDVAPSLLERLLAERMADAVRNIFNLLVIFHDRAHVRDVERALVGGAAAERGHAVEYFDNILDPAFRRSVLPVIDERPIDEKLDAARTLFGVAVTTRLDVLSALIEQPLEDDSEASGWAAAALYEIYATRTAHLYPAVAKIRQSATAEPLVRETAEWVCARIGIAANA